jgi:succinate dehydrogenase / fumarate reductase flavoprotein subunit
VAAADVSQEVFDAAVRREKDRQDALVSNDGDENPYTLWQEMGKWMTDTCTVVRYNERLEECLNRCQDWKARYERVKLSDTGMWTNQNLSFTRALRDMIIQAEAILVGALQRNESRGAHYKPQYPDRLDEQYLKATIAEYDEAGDRPRISYGPVDTSLVPPRARTYGKKDAKAAGAAGTTGDVTKASAAVSVAAK